MRGGRFIKDLERFLARLAAKFKAPAAEVLPKWQARGQYSSYAHSDSFERHALFRPINGEIGQKCSFPTRRSSW
jgi:hypothetical protein